MLKRRVVLLFLAVMFLLLIVTGCTKVRFTTGVSQNEFAKSRNFVISTEVADIIFSEQKYSYEKLFNNNIWSEEIGNMTVEEYVVDSVKKLITNLVYLNQIAEDMQITLTDEEKRKIEETAENYVKDIEGTSLEAVKNLYEMILISEKTFYALTDDVDTEVSTDEARVISVQYIFISTVKKDENGKLVDMSESEYNRTQKRAKEIWQMVKDGGDVISLAVENSDDSVYTMEFGRGQYLKKFEDAAFALEIGDISNVVETEHGFYIIKCINDNIENNIQKRKADIILGRRQDIFVEQYEKDIAKKEIIFNKKYLKKLNMKDIKSGSGLLYEEYKKHLLALE